MKVKKVLIVHSVLHAQEPPSTIHPKRTSALYQLLNLWAALILLRAFMTLDLRWTTDANTCSLPTATYQQEIRKHVGWKQGEEMKELEREREVFFKRVRVFVRGKKEKGQDR